MKAVGYKAPLPVSDASSLLDIEATAAVPGGRDIRVAVKAISVNPVDTKVRSAVKPANGDEYKILGYDAAGVVESVGPEVTLFRPGDEVYYAGSIQRPGTNSELHLVDERIVGRKPKTLSFAEAAALPLTSITAWELLFDRLGAQRGRSTNAADAIPQAILISGAAGGVGSMLIQFAHQLTSLKVIATVSRDETRDWCKSLGADYTIDRTSPIKDQVAALGPIRVPLIASLTGTDQNFGDLIKVLDPQGRIGVIDDPKVLDVVPLKGKSASLHWEAMFARSAFKTDDMIEQHHLLNKVAQLIDTKLLRTTMTHNLGTINAANLRKAHAMVESGTMIGKVVLEGW